MVSLVLVRFVLGSVSVMEHADSLQDVSFLHRGRPFSKTLQRSRCAVLCIYLNYKESGIQTIDNLIGSLLRQLL